MSWGRGRDREGDTESETGLTSRTPLSSSPEINLFSFFFLVYITMGGILDMMNWGIYQERLRVNTLYSDVYCSVISIPNLET